MRGEGDSRKKRKMYLKWPLPDDPSAGCLFRSSWNGTYKQKQNVLRIRQGLEGGRGSKKKRKMYLKWSSLMIPLQVASIRSSWNGTYKQKQNV